MTQIHVEPPPTPLIKIKYDDKLEKIFVKLKMRRGPMPSLSGLYGFKMTLFDNGDPEELFLFVQNFNITLAVSEALVTGAKIQYICTLVCG